MLGLTVGRRVEVERGDMSGLMIMMVFWHAFDFSTGPQAKTFFFFKQIFFASSHVKSLNCLLCIIVWIVIILTIVLLTFE